MALSLKLDARIEDTIGDELYPVGTLLGLRVIVEVRRLVRVEVVL